MHKQSLTLSDASSNSQTQSTLDSPPAYSIAIATLPLPPPPPTFSEPKAIPGAQVSNTVEAPGVLKNTMVSTVSSSVSIFDPTVMYVQSITGQSHGIINGPQDYPVKPHPAAAIGI